MDLWQNFPDPTYVRDADGRLLCVFARREEYAENPRRDFDHPDHLAMFGDLDWLTDGAGIRRRDPEGVLRSLLEDACTPEEVVAFVAEGGLTDHELVGSPFGPHPLLVGYEGTGYTGKLEGDGALDCIRELVEAGRRAPSLEGATEPDLWDALEAGPVDGFALIPCPWPTGDYLLVDETDPDCAPSVEATRDLRLLGGLCLDALSAEPADAARLLASRGVYLRAVVASGDPRDPWRVDGWDLAVLASLGERARPVDGFQWVSKGDVDRGEVETWEQAASKLMDSELSVLNAWLQGEVWTCEADEVFGSGDDVCHDVIVVDGQDPAEQCLAVLGLEDAVAVPAPDLTDAVSCAVAEVAAQAKAAGTAPTVADAVSLVTRDRTLWIRWVETAVKCFPDVRLALQGHLEEACGSAMA